MPVSTRPAETGKECGSLGAALASEQQALPIARQALLEGEEIPEVYQTTVSGPNGQPHKAIHRAYGRHEGKVAQLEKDVERHEDRIETLTRDLAHSPCPPEQGAP